MAAAGGSTPTGRAGPAAPAWRSWSGLLLPLACPGCGTPEEVVCPPCRDRLLRGPLRRRAVPDGTWVVAAASFRGPVRGLVVAAKERGRRDVGEVLALALARAVADAGWREARHRDRLLLVPPPSRRAAVWRRADRPTEQLAASAARLLRAAGADVQAMEVLRLTRSVRDQAGLSREERAENLAGAFAVRSSVGPPAGCDVLVVDDVLTTGATVHAAATALRAAGAQVLGAAVVAAV